MSPLTFEQVNALAPDPAALKAGQGLAHSRHWTGLGSSDVALWGLCRGSGQEPYKVRVDLATNGYACTCPSRKFPCKHILGLLLLAAASPAHLAEAAPPTWVREWLEKRAARSQAELKRAEPKADLKSREKDAARRAARREDLAGTGVAALERWLKDFARLGLAATQSVPASFWNDQAARMVDCQLPGAARMIRELQSLPGSRPDWGEILLLRLGRLYLLVQAFRKQNELPEAVQQEVRALLGWTVNQDELVAASPGIRDDWLVLAARTGQDDKTGLLRRESWLWGRNSRHPAQILNYAPHGQPLDASLIPGLALRGVLVYYPGAYPLRAVFKEKQAAQDSFVPSGFKNLAGFFKEYTAALGVNPWLEVFPVVLEEVIPQCAGQSWLLRDAQNQAIPLSAHFTSRWELLALSGGHATVVFGLWDGFSLLPMSAWLGERYVNLEPADLAVL